MGEIAGILGASLAVFVFTFCISFLVGVVIRAKDSEMIFALTFCIAAGLFFLGAYGRGTAAEPLMWDAASVISTVIGWLIAAFCLRSLFDSSGRFTLYQQAASAKQELPMSEPGVASMEFVKTSEFQPVETSDKTHSIRMTILRVAIGLLISIAVGAVVREILRNNSPSTPLTAALVEPGPVLTPASQKRQSPTRVSIKKKDAGFSVEMPSQPKESSETMQLGTYPILVHYLTCDIGNESYAIIYYDISSDFDRQTANPNTMFNVIREGMLRKISGTRLLSESSTKLDTHPGKEFIFDVKDQAKFILRAYCANGKVYQVLYTREFATGKTISELASQDAFRFFASFHLTGPGETKELYDEELSPMVSTEDRTAILGILLEHGTLPKDLGAKYSQLMQSGINYLSTEEREELMNIRNEGMRALSSEERQEFDVIYEKIISHESTTATEAAYVNKVINKALLSLPKTLLSRFQSLTATGMRRALADQQ